MTTSTSLLVYAELGNVKKITSIQLGKQIPEACNNLKQFCQCCNKVFTGLMRLTLEQKCVMIYLKCCGVMINGKIVISL